MSHELIVISTVALLVVAVILLAEWQYRRSLTVSWWVETDTKIIGPFKTRSDAQMLFDGYVFSKPKGWKP